MSQADMAEKLLVSQPSYWKYEVGKNEPSAETMQRMHELDLNIDWLITGAGEMLVRDQYAKIEYPPPVQSNGPPESEKQVYRLEGKVEALESEIRYYREEIKQVLRDCADQKKIGPVSAERFGRNIAPLAAAV